MKKIMSAMMVIVCGLLMGSVVHGSQETELMGSVVHGSRETELMADSYDVNGYSIAC